MAKSIRLIAWLSCLVILASCSSFESTDTVRDEQGSVVTKPQQLADPGFESSEQVLTKNDVMVQFKQQAQMAQNQGQFDQAEVILTRALRISGDDAELYAQLAGLRVQQGRYDEAEQLALKGLTHADKDSEAYTQLNKLVEQLRAY